MKNHTEEQGKEDKIVEIKKTDIPLNLCVVYFL